MTFEEIKAKIAQDQKKVTLQLEVVSYDSQTGKKLSKPHNVEYEVKYLESEVKNLEALGYTVTLVESGSEVKNLETGESGETRKRKTNIHQNG